MRFGRVEGVVSPIESDGRSLLRLTVWLETSTRLETIREEILAPVRGIDTFADLIWHADQWTQETIGTTLAEQGWEAIAASDLPAADEVENGQEPGALPRSASYAVRNLSWG
ncbi:MAG: hypothetical protein H0T18_02745 [Chloroflexia bacterium]|nr:hypothetical protein [Chloroflexia bacterium]